MDTNTEIEDLLRTADPHSPRPTPELDDAAADLLNQITAHPPVTRAAMVRMRRERRRRRTLRARLAISVATAAAVTGAIAVPALLAQPTGTAPEARPGTDDPSSRPIVTTPVHYTAAAIRVARANPRLLVRAEGWKVRTLEGLDPRAGQTTFQFGPDKWHEVEHADGSGWRVNEAPALRVIWSPRDQYAAHLAGRGDEPGAHQVDVLGQQALLVDYSASDHAVVLPPSGAVFLELRGSNLGDEQAFLAFLDAHVERVDVPTWLAAMPPEIVTAGGAAAATEKVLAGVPLPPDFDSTILRQGQALDPYQFGARVAGAVACGWIEEWSRARAAGEDAAATRAAAALATSHDWKVLHDMDAEGGYPEVVWEYADQVAAGEVPEGYRGALGCR